MNESLARPELHIEPLKGADLPEVLAIERRSFENPWSLAAFQREMSKSYANLDVARPLSGEMVGAVVGYVCFWLVADEVQIANLAVHSAYRRRGTGRRLMLHALERGCEAGAQVAVLEVRRSNEAARALYESLGFKTVRERPGYYAEFREPGLVLELGLDESWWQR